MGIGTHAIERQLVSDPAACAAAEYGSPKGTAPGFVRSPTLAERTGREETSGRSKSGDAILEAMTHSILFEHMLVLPLPIAEKLLRPVIVYLVLVALLRLFGKRELAQLNPFDLVVLLSLSNTVQNAIIGDDNSVTGGVIGAFALLAINWLVVRILYRSPRLTRAFEGRSTMLIRNGQIDWRALRRESLSREELLSVLHKQGFEGVHQVHSCELEPNGTFYVEALEPSVADRRHTELLARLEQISKEITVLRARPAGEV
jgi:uncharacterized membrane protein YcaP (DUF421 family)